MFEERFDEDLKGDKIESMRITSYTAEVVEELLRFIYAGDHPQGEDTISLFRIAAEFNIEMLKNLCEEKILIKISQENALDVLFLGNTYESEKLKTKAFLEIKKMFPGSSRKRRNLLFVLQNINLVLQKSRILFFNFCWY